MLFPFSKYKGEVFYFLTTVVSRLYIVPLLFFKYIMVKAQDLQDRGFTSKGFSGEWILNKDYTTFIVILGRYESIEVYRNGNMQSAFPINSIHHVDEVVYLN